LSIRHGDLTVARRALPWVAGVIWATSVAAAELNVRVANPPTNGAVVVLLFKSAGTFVALRDPARVVTLPSAGPPAGQILDLPAGEYALVVYHDANGNGRLDKNFVGIPKEPLGFSNSYWPQGPPTFSHAVFRIEEGETKTCDIKLKSVFGKRGLLGAGGGVITQTSPYRDSRDIIVRPVPVVTYIGERVQILGTTAQCDVLNWGDVALAATARYRFGAYHEEDSPCLQGLGDRDDTITGGLAIQVRLPAGCELSAGYEHDLLDRTGGGTGRMALNKALQRGWVTVSPELALNWLTADLADYEYGVPGDQSREGRPAYHPGDTVNLETGAAMFVELYGHWRLVLVGSITFLPSAITASPLVGQSPVFSGFTAVNRTF